MPDERDPLLPFDDDIVDHVAAQSDLRAEDLRELLVRHQELVRGNPGVDDVVYEWRTQFHEEPLIERTEGAYYLRLREHVWEEYAEALDAPETHFLALLDVHDRQVRAATGAGADEGERLMVLARE